MNTTFTPDLIHNFDRLKTLFTGEKELAEIDQLPEETLVRPKDFLYFNRWQVAWIILSSGFTFYTYLFLKIFENVTYYLHLRLLSNRLHVLGAYLTLNIEHLWSQMSYGSALWVPSINEYQLNLSDVYNQYPVKRDDILDPKIQQKLNVNLNQIDFYMPKGLCWGGVHWFNFLLLKELEKKKSISEAIVAVAKQFENGQPRQAALLQSIYGLQNDLLDMDYSLEKDSSNLKAGVYTLQLPDHAVSYIKHSNKQFIWDPCSGLIALEGPEQLLEFIQKKCEGKEKIPVHFALQNLKYGIFLRLQKILKFTTLFGIYV